MGHLQCIIGLSLVVILMCLKSCNAIQCYECNSYTNTQCMEVKGNSELLTDCSKKGDGKQYKLCRKIKQVIDFEVNGLQPESRIIRTCGWDNSSYLNKCYQRSGFGGRQEVCACDTDNCNSSGSLYASFLLLSGLLLALNQINL